MEIKDNRGKKIGRLDESMSNDKMVTVHELRNITTITVRDRNTGKVTTETLIGESPFGKQPKHAPTSFSGRVGP